MAQVLAYSAIAPASAPTNEAVCMAASTMAGVVTMGVRAASMAIPVKVAPLSQQLPGPSPLRAPVSNTQDCRKIWAVGSILEYCSVSSGCWFPAIVTAMSPDGQTLTVQFLNQERCPQHKAVLRSDWRLEPFGRHERNLPSDFQVTPSQSRPGHLSYIDTSTGVKYASPELAWRVHLERSLQSGGQPTVCEVHQEAGASKQFVWPSVAEELSTDLPSSSVAQTSKQVPQLLQPRVSNIGFPASDSKEEPLTSVSSWSSTLTPDVDVGGNQDLKASSKVSPTSVESKFEQTPEVVLTKSQFNAEQLVQTEHCADDALCRAKGGVEFGMEALEETFCQVMDVQGDATISMPAPSPSAIPESKFAWSMGKMPQSISWEEFANKSCSTTCSELMNKDLDECDGSPGRGRCFTLESSVDDAKDFTCDNVLMTESSLRQHAQPAPEPPIIAWSAPAVEIIHQKPQPRDERVAKLEGALEMSRDHVRQLENEIKNKGAEMTGPCAKLEGALQASRERVLQLEAELRRKGADATQLHKRVEELDVARKETKVDLEVLDRVMALENSLQFRAEELEGRRQMSKGDKALSLEALEQYESRFKHLQQEIQSREERVREASKVHDRRARDLHQLGAILKAREDATAEYQERLANWEQRLSLTEELSSLQCERQRSPSGGPPVRRRFSTGSIKPVGPPRNPRSLPRARTPPRTPQQMHRNVSSDKRRTNGSPDRSMLKPPPLHCPAPAKAAKMGAPQISGGNSPASCTGTPKRHSYPSPAHSRGNTPTRWHFMGASGKLFAEPCQWTTTYQTSFSP